MPRNNPEKSGSLSASATGGTPPLRRVGDPVNDATNMAPVLAVLGFEVIKGTDNSLVKMRRLIREFGEKRR